MVQSGRALVAGAERKTGMQQSKQKKPPLQEVKKPILKGSWHGKDAVRLGGKVMANLLMVTVLFLLLGTLTSFDSLILRALFSGVLVLAAFAMLFNQGVTRGQQDAAFAEIMYVRSSEGKPVSPSDQARCYHPGKGYFAALLGALPYVLIAAVFALLTRPVQYTLGVIPGWISDLTRQSEFGNALSYYSSARGIGWMDVLRIIDRAMVMPFVNVAILLGDQAVLWVERLSPLLVCIAPLGFGIGYRKGLMARIRINTGIAIGDEKKRRRERKERKRRARSDSPERLI